MRSTGAFSKRRSPRFPTSTPSSNTNRPEPRVGDQRQDRRRAGKSPILRGFGSSLLRGRSRLSSSTGRSLAGACCRSGCSPGFGSSSGTSASPIIDCCRLRTFSLAISPGRRRTSTPPNAGRSASIPIRGRRRSKPCSSRWRRRRCGCWSASPSLRSPASAWGS